MSSPGVSKQRVEITNKYGEKLVGVLHSTGSKKLVIVCHGFRSMKEEKLIVSLIAALTSEGISAFHFDFSGHGESDGEFQFGNFSKQADEIHAVVIYFSEKNFKICAVCGASKGGNVVLLYASMHNDVSVIINISGRFVLERGIDGLLGKNFRQRIQNDGFVDVKDKTGKVEFRVTEESLIDHITTDMRGACHIIDKECRVLTIHGSADEYVPLEDAFEFDKIIPNHKLHIIEGADHCYTAHQEELNSLVVHLIKSLLWCSDSEYQGKLYPQDHES